MRLPLAVAALVAVAAGCGREAAPAGPPPTESEARAFVDAFVAARGDREAGAAEVFVGPGARAAFLETSGDPQAPMFLYPEGGTPIGEIERMVREGGGYLAEVQISIESGEQCFPVPLVEHLLVEPAPEDRGVDGLWISRASAEPIGSAA